MRTTLTTDITVRQICNGFVYNELEGRGLFGMGGQLIIQPEYQRHYIYGSDGKDAAVIDSVLKGYPLGVIYLVRRTDGMLEVLDGQQRITSLGRYVTNRFAINDANGMPQIFDGLADDLKDRILDTKLFIYICEGTESEIKNWFMTVNIAGVPLKAQELLNAVYCGEFVTRAKAVFSNSNNARIQIWSHYLKGEVKRQDYLETALSWVSHGDISGYMATHRHDDNIHELETYFKTVIDWIPSVFNFKKPRKEMKGLEWGRLYRDFHTNAYNQEEVCALVDMLLSDDCVKNPKGVFEYVLGGCKEPRLLDIRVFNNKIKKRVYDRQTREAVAAGVSNCPDCAIGHGANHAKIWELEDMDADHVKAWSRGGETSEANCQMLCKHHNRAKGNK